MEHYPVVRYSTSDLGNKGTLDRVELDNVVLDRWDRFMQEGNFRYKTNNIKERVVEGKLGYLVQSRVGRATLRRQPQTMTSIKQEFEKDKFNFNKIDESKELVCQLVNTDRESKHVERDILIINVSPIDRGHCLLVPRVEAGLQQVCCCEGVSGTVSGCPLSPTVFHVLTVHSITLALELMNLSTSSHTKLAFNSMCAYASVNHQHWHFYYQPTRLALQSLPLSPWPDTPYYTFREEDYPALGWVWLLRVRDMDKMDQVAREVAKLTMWLTDKEVAHNVVMSRGAGLEGGQGCNYIRVQLWARESVVGAKDPGEFTMASLELSGQILVSEVDKYNTLIEEEVVKAQKKATVAVFAMLKAEVEKLFRKH